jgi:hypothetical protein
MPLQWDQPNQKFYESGVSKGAVYVHQGPIQPTDEIPGVAWEGLMSVTESPTGAEITKLWANDMEYTQLVSMEEMEGKIEAHWYPEEFNPALGVLSPTPGFIVPQQALQYFSLAYQTRIHSDGGGEDIGYQIHILYNLTVKPFERNNMTMSDTPESMTFNWDFTNTKVNGVPGIDRPFSKLVFDSRTVDPAVLADINDILYTQELLFNPWDLEALHTPE